MFGFFKKRRRARLRSAPMPREWLGIIKRNFPLYNRLPPEDQAELCGHIQVFVSEKHFEGCGGLDITDEIRLTIAAQACLLLLHRNSQYYRHLTSILVYPTAYLAKAINPDGLGVITEDEFPRLGEAWSHGTVVLSWDDVRHGAADIHDGQNVVLHEFAHVLDGETGDTEGAPVLEQRSRYVTWARVLGQAYEKLQRDTALGNPTVLNEYGATNPAEFFAVATEAFFEKPKQLKKKHPKLYDELRAFFKQDPVSYVR
ncbi:MAG: zinc-dependent peptidase [Candidatus Latescibacterota bacterium]|nr:MAG: zinc-dependent peptidase [Candidatus Latescibacterota bacterium]